MISSWPKTLLVIGGGKMGAAMLEGWFKKGLNGAAVTIIDPHPSEHLVTLAATHNCTLNPASLNLFDVVVLAIKPQMFEAVASQIQHAVAPHTIVLSIMAGKNIASLSAHLQNTLAIVRAMPNTPAAIGRGITGIYAAALLEPQKAIVQTLLSAVGQVVWLDAEADMDAVTAVSGSGPAYVFYLVECMAKAGEAAGLSCEIAMQLARATVEGAGELLFQSPQLEASTLRVGVTSPNGTTQAALEALTEKNEFYFLLKKAILAAKQRSFELSI